jgi:hypothetical protein
MVKGQDDKAMRCIVGVGVSGATVRLAYCNEAFIMVMNISCEMGGHVRRITYHLHSTSCHVWYILTETTPRIYLIHGETPTFTASDALCLLGVA